MRDLPRVPSNGRRATHRLRPVTGRFGRQSDHAAPKTARAPCWCKAAARPAADRTRCGRVRRCCFWLAGDHSPRLRIRVFPSVRTPPDRRRRGDGHVRTSALPESARRDIASIRQRRACEFAQIQASRRRRRASSAERALHRYRTGSARRSASPAYGEEDAQRGRCPCRRLDRELTAVARSKAIVRVEAERWLLTLWWIRHESRHRTPLLPRMWPL